MLKEVKGILDGYLKSASETLAFFVLLSGLSLVVGRLIYADWADRNGIYKAVGEPWEYVALGALPALALAIYLLGLHLGIKIRKKDGHGQIEFLAKVVGGFYGYFIVSFILAVFLPIFGIAYKGFLENFAVIAMVFLTLSVLAGLSIIVGVVLFMNNQPILERALLRLNRFFKRALSFSFFAIAVLATIAPNAPWSSWVVAVIAAVVVSYLLRNWEAFWLEQTSLSLAAFAFAFLFVSTLFHTTRNAYPVAMPRSFGGTQPVEVRVTLHKDLRYAIPVCYVAGESGSAFSVDGKLLQETATTLELKLLKPSDKNCQSKDLDDGIWTIPKTYVITQMSKSPR